jgi:transcriptional regulator with XRE-family HTH domain
MEHPVSRAALPPHLLEDPKLLAAFHRRDFAEVFTTAHRHGISYNKISEACGIKAERVSQIASGRRTVTMMATIERIADGLRIGGRHLGLAERPWEQQAPRSAPQETHDGDDPMKRRALLRGALASGITGPAVAALTGARHDLDTALTGHPTTDLSYWESTAERYSYGYGGQAPTDVLAGLLAECAELRPLLAAPQTISARTGLCRVTAQLAGMTAIVLHDLGEHREAHAWFHSAGRAAQEADPHLHAWVLAREAMVAVNYGAPSAAAALAERACGLAGKHPSAASALAWAVAARAHAASGNRDNALPALHQADQLMEQLPVSDAADTWYGYPEQKHHVHASQVCTLLGETQRAHAAQQRATELSRRPSVMTRALLGVDRAACLAHDGEPTEAAIVAADAYTTLPASYRRGLTQIRARAVYDTVRDTPEAAHLRHALTPAA